MLRKLKLWRVAVLLAVFAVPAWAARAPLPPIELCNADQICAPSVLTEAAGVNPIAEGDLPNLTSAQWASHTTNETGSGALCFATSPSLVTPSIAGGTYTGTHDFTGATTNLPADAVDNIGEISDSILGGGASHGPRLATQENAPTANRCARFNANGVLVAHTDDCSSSTPIKGLIFSESQFPIPDGDVITYVSLAGNISSVTGEAQSLVHENMTVGGCCCVYTEEPGTALVVTLASGTYGAALSDSSIAITLVDADTPVCDADTLALTQNQGANWEVDGDSGTAEGQLRCGCNRTV